MNDIVLKAVAVALKAYPALNSALIDGAIHQYGTIHLSVSVDVDDGLVVPVLHRAGTLDLGGVASGVADLTARAKASKLTLEDIEGATFTVSNVNAPSVDWFTPVLNPPQVRAAGIRQDTPHPGRGGARGPDPGHRDVRADIGPPGAGRGTGGGGSWLGSSGCWNPWTPRCFQTPPSAPGDAAIFVRSRDDRTRIHDQMTLHANSVPLFSIVGARPHTSGICRAPPVPIPFVEKVHRKVTHEFEPTTVIRRDDIRGDATFLEVTCKLGATISERSGSLRRIQQRAGGEKHGSMQVGLFNLRPDLTRHPLSEIVEDGPIAHAHLQRIKGAGREHAACDHAHQVVDEQRPPNAFTRIFFPNFSVDATKEFSDARLQATE